MSSISQYHGKAIKFSGKPLKLLFFFLKDPPPTELSPLPHHAALPISTARLAARRPIHTGREQQEALRDGRAIVLIPSGIHSNEVGGHLTPALLAYRLASDTGTATRRILDNVILLLVPSLNPDGVSIVTHWYNRTLGTAAEGTGRPSCTTITLDTT